MFNFGSSNLSEEQKVLDCLRTVIAELRHIRERFNTNDNIQNKTKIKIVDNSIDELSSIFVLF